MFICHVSSHNHNEFIIYRVEYYKFIWKCGNTHTHLLSFQCFNGSTTIVREDCHKLMGTLEDTRSDIVQEISFGHWVKRLWEIKLESGRCLIQFVCMYWHLRIKFQPKRNSTAATYTFCQEGTFAPVSEARIGMKVQATYKGSRIQGAITGIKTKKGRKTWQVSFEDGYATSCDAWKQTEKMADTPGQKIRTVGLS